MCSECGIIRQSEEHKFWWGRHLIRGISFFLPTSILHSHFDIKLTITTLSLSRPRAAASGCGPTNCLAQIPQARAHTIKFVPQRSHRILHAMVQGDLPQSRQDNSIESSPSEEAIQDRLRSQNAALNAEKVRLQQECANLETLLSAHTLGKDCSLDRQRQSSCAPESGTTTKNQS